MMMNVCLNIVYWIYIKMLSHIYVINLDRDTKRLETITNSFNAQGLSFHRFRGIVGKELPTEELKPNVDNFCLNYGCTSGMIGCGLSHLSLYRKLVDDPYADKYIIMEDDASIDDKFEQTIREIENTDLNYDILYLRCMSTINCMHIAVYAKLSTGFTVGKSLAPVTLAGYIITKEGARKVLEEIPKLRWHIDVCILDAGNKNKLNLYTLQPNLVKLSSECFSSTLTNFKSYSPALTFVNYIDDRLSWWGTIPLLSFRRTFTINAHFVLAIVILILVVKYVNNKYVTGYFTLELVIATLLLLSII